jgi:hypothetical protein
MRNSGDASSVAKTEALGLGDDAFVRREMKIRPGS